MVADIEELGEMAASELHARRLNAKEVLTSMKGQSQMEQSKPLEEIRMWSHPLWSRSVQIEERNKKFFEGNQTDLLQPHFKMTVHWMLRKPKMTTGLSQRFHLSPSRGTQSQTVHAKRRIISYSAEVHRRLQNNTYVAGCLVEKTN